MKEYIRYFIFSLILGMSANSSAKVCDGYEKKTYDSYNINEDYKDDVDKCCTRAEYYDKKDEEMFHRSKGDYLSDCLSKAEKVADGRIQLKNERESEESKENNVQKVATPSNSSNTSSQNRFGSHQAFCVQNPDAGDDICKNP